MKSLKTRLANFKAGKFEKPYTAPDYSSRWGGQTFAIGENVGFRNTFGRWHENPETPFRFLGLAHKLINLSYTGWLTEEDNYDVLARGVVYMLTHDRYLAAIANSCQSAEDGTGPCIVMTDSQGNPYLYDDKEEAARAADSFAERYAEACREDERLHREEQEAEEAAREAEEAGTMACRGIVTV